MISRKMPKTSKNTIALSCVYLLIPACAMAKTEKNCCLVESCFILCDNTLHRGTGKSSKHFETTWWISLRLHDPEFLEVLSSDLLHSAVKGLTNMRSTIKIFGTWKHKNILITKIHWNKKYPDLWFKKMLHRQLQTSNVVASPNSLPPLWSICFQQRVAVQLRRSSPANLQTSEVENPDL